MGVAHKERSVDYRWLIEREIGRLTEIDQILMEYASSYWSSVYSTKAIVQGKGVPRRIAVIARHGYQLAKGNHRSTWVYLVNRLWIKWGAEASYAETVQPVQAWTMDVKLRWRWWWWLLNNEWSIIRTNEHLNICINEQYKWMAKFPTLATLIKWAKMSALKRVLRADSISFWTRKFNWKEKHI